MAVLVANCPILSDTRNNDGRPETRASRPFRYCQCLGCDPNSHWQSGGQGLDPLSSTNEINCSEAETNSADSPLLILVPIKPCFDAIPAFAALPHPFFFQSSMAAAPDLNPGSTGIALVRGTTRIPMKLTTDSGDGRWFLVGRYRIPIFP